MNGSVICIVITAWLDTLETSSLYWNERVSHLRSNYSMAGYFRDAIV